MGSLTGLIPYAPRSRAFPCIPHRCTLGIAPFAEPPSIAGLVELPGPAAGVGLVGAAGLEPATLGFEGRCSIQLNYAPLTQSGR